MAQPIDDDNDYENNKRLQDEFSRRLRANFQASLNDMLNSEYYINRRKYRGLWIGDMVQSVEEQIKLFLEKFPEEEFGCGHIVLSDENLDDSSIQFCINRGKQFLAGDEKIVADFDYSTEGTVATIGFLESLLAIPEDERGEWLDD